MEEGEPIPFIQGWVRVVVRREAEGRFKGTVHDSVASQGKRRHH